MKVQLPPNSATRSAMRWPAVSDRSNSTLMFSASVSCALTLLTTSVSSVDSSPRSASRASSTYSARNRLRHAWQIVRSADHVGCAFRYELCHGATNEGAGA